MFAIKHFYFLWQKILASMSSCTTEPALLLLLVCLSISLYLISLPLFNYLYLLFIPLSLSPLSLSLPLSHFSFSHYHLFFSLIISLSSLLFFFLFLSLIISISSLLCPFYFFIFSTLLQRSLHTPSPSLYSFQSASFYLSLSLNNNQWTYYIHMISCKKHLPLPQWFSTFLTL